MAMSPKSKDWSPEYVIAFERYEDLVRFADQERLGREAMVGRVAAGRVTEWLEDTARGAVCTIKPLQGTKLCKDEMPPLQVQIDLGETKE